MTNNIKLRIAVVLFSILTTFSSCLKNNLPTYPVWDGSNIDNVYIEYRYNGSQLMNGDPVVAYQKMTVSSVVDNANSTITSKLTIPAASGTFTVAERAKVTLSHLWMYFDVSTAASIAAVGDSPIPGNAGDLSRPLAYEVTAANGQKRKWTINVVLQ